MLVLYTLPDQPQVAYEEVNRSGAILEDPETVASCCENYDLLRAMALSPGDSEAMIRSVLEDLTPCEPHRT